MGGVEMHNVGFDLLGRQNWSNIPGGVRSKTGQFVKQNKPNNQLYWLRVCGVIQMLYYVHVCRVGVCIGSVIFGNPIKLELHFGSKKDRISPNRSEAQHQMFSFPISQNSPVNHR